MTALDQSANLASANTIRELIDSCLDTHDGFRSAAETVGSSTLKRLFSLYAQQRSRFAEELGGFASWSSADCGSGFQADPAQEMNDARLLSDCLRREKSALARYRKALSERSLPTKTRFLVASQLALLERVHNRIESMGNMNERSVLVSYQRATV